MKKIVILTGAGISAESGIDTFRDSEGLWEKHDIEDVATPGGFRRNPKLVLDFYNGLRRKLMGVEPNYGHEGLVELEENYDVSIVTQNVDDLHERAGSTGVLHLHGELTKSRYVNSEETFHIGYDDINLGDTDKHGNQSRPHIVWFTEQVPNLATASSLVREADIVVVIGTSLNVYPAAGLVYETKKSTPIYVIDPSDLEIQSDRKITYIKKKATDGVKELLEILENERKKK